MKKKNNYRNAGRRPILDKKQVVRIWLERSKIKALGGDEGVKNLCYEMVNEKVSQSV